MRVLVTGGGGFLGSKLIAALLAGRDGLPQAERIVSLDRIAPAIDDPRLATLTGSLSDEGLLEGAFGDGIDMVWHLAAAVSAECEADLDLGLTVNLEGTLALLQAARAAGKVPRLVFASSLAAYGGDLPETVDDQTPITPDGSYGTQKAIGELLVKDFGRRGLVDGRSIRLPTVVVRPGKPNRAASGFASGILREPLAGQPSRCPVPPETRMAIVSPRQAVDGLLRAAVLPAEAFGPGRVFNQPGLTVSVAEMIESLRLVAGDAAVELIDMSPEPDITRLVCSWPQGVASARAVAAGLRADADMDAVLRCYLEDELGRS